MAVGEARTRAEAGQAAAERRAEEDRAAADRVQAELEQLRTESQGFVELASNAASRVTSQRTIAT